MRNLALDLGVAKVCLSEARDGKIVARRSVKTVVELRDIVGPDTPSARVALEACREAWSVIELLEEWGHEAVLVDTTRVKKLGVGAHGRKNDRIDADVLALALEKDLVPRAHVLSPSRQQLRHHLAVRDALVQSRAEFVTRVRGLARAHGIKLPKCETRTFTAKLLTCSIDAALHKLLAPLLKTIDTIDGELVDVELALEERCLSEPKIVRLATTPGVSKIVAATFVSVIDEAERFRNAHQVEAYLGLVPSESTTGGRRRLGSITKQGNLYARTALTEAAWCIYRSRGNDPLKLWARAVARRRGNKIAVTALARRLAGVLWAMWRDGTVYEPVRVAMETAGGLRGAAQSTELQAEAFERAARKLKRLGVEAARSVRRRRALSEVTVKN